MCDAGAEWFLGRERTRFTPRPLRALLRRRQSCLSAALRAPTTGYLSHTLLRNSAS